MPHICLGAGPAAGASTHAQLPAAGLAALRSGIAISAHALLVDTCGVAGASRWRFPRGAEFGAAHNWWGKQSARARPHEGLDFVEAVTSGGEALRVRPGQQVRTAADGVVAAVFDDFIGQTVLLHVRPSSL
jgi:hypothetical protein